MAHDASFKVDAKKNPVLSKELNYILSTLNILFRTVPGMDEYEPTKGLDIASKTMSTYMENQRDVEYESEIASQVERYTDFSVASVVAIYSKTRLTISLEVMYNKNLYTLITGDDGNTLEALIKT